MARQSAARGLESATYQGEGVTRNEVEPPGLQSSPGGSICRKGLDMPHSTQPGRQIDEPPDDEQVLAAWRRYVNIVNEGTLPADDDPRVWRDWHRSQAIRYTGSGWLDRQYKTGHLRDAERFDEFAKREAAEVEAIAPPKAAPKAAPLKAGVDQRRPNAAVLADQLAGLGITLRYNVRSRLREYQDGETDWQPVSDLAEDSWFDRIASVVLDTKAQPYRWTGETRKTSWNAVFAANQVDPFQEWLDQLPAWDGQPRQAQWLQQIFPYRHEDSAPELIQWASTAIIARAIERTYKPGCKQDVSPVIVGPPGLGKTTALAWLFPKKHRGEWYGTVHIDVRPGTEGRAIEATMGRVICEAGELSGLGKASISALKTWLTAGRDRYRLAYDRNVSDIRRRFSLVATANPEPARAIPFDKGLIRRLLIVEFQDLDDPDVSAQRVRNWLDDNRMQLWAEGLHRHHQGTDDRLPAHLMEQAIEATSNYRRTDETAERTVDALLNEEGEYLSSARVDQAATDAGTRIGILREALRARGATPTRISEDGKQIRVWLKPDKPMQPSFNL